MGELIDIRTRLPGEEDMYWKLSDEFHALESERHELDDQEDELMRGFVENSLVFQSGKRKGKPLDETGRRRVLNKLLDLHLEIQEKWDRADVIWHRAKTIDERLCRNYESEAEDSHA